MRQQLSPLWFLVLTPRARFTYLLLSALLLTVQIFPGQIFAQSSQNLVPNGDFSNGLNGWTPGVIKPSAFPGYPKWGMFDTTNFRAGVNPFAFLDVPGGAEAYLDSSPFVLPNQPGNWTLDFLLWGLHDPTILGVQLKTPAGFYSLDSFAPPKVELGQQPVTKHYSVPANFTGGTVTVRFTCEGVNPADSHGVYCAYDDVAVMPTQTQTTHIVPAGSDLGPAVTLLFVGIGLALGAAGAGVGLAFRAPRTGVYSCPLCGTHIEREWPFCRRCGTQLWNWRNHCSWCGGHVPAWARYCARCGFDRFLYLRSIE